MSAGEGDAVAFAAALRHWRESVPVRQRELGRGGRWRLALCSSAQVNRSQSSASGVRVLLLGGVASSVSVFFRLQLRLRARGVASCALSVAPPSGAVSTISTLSGDSFNFTHTLSFLSHSSICPQLQ